MTTPPDQDPTAAAYDAVAESYAAALPDDSYEADLDQAIIDVFAARVAKTSGRRVVDAGCGSGRMAPVPARHGLQYLGVDISREMVRVAGARHREHDFVTGPSRSSPDRTGPRTASSPGIRSSTPRPWTCPRPCRSSGVC